MSRYSLSPRSKSELETCDDRIQRVIFKALELIDVSVLDGFRDADEQNKAFETGKSKVKFPDSKHNKKPSLAVDVAKSPIDWNDVNSFYFLAGTILTIAHYEGVKLRWGGDFNRDGNMKNDKFIDLPHFEIDE